MEACLSVTGLLRCLSGEPLFSSLRRDSHLSQNPDVSLSNHRKTEESRSSNQSDVEQKMKQNLSN